MALAQEEMLYRLDRGLARLGVGVVQLGHGAMQHFVALAFGQRLKNRFNALALG